MDSLPLPLGSPVIQVPIVSTEPYDGGDFFSYPQRRGWDVSTWRRFLISESHLRDFDLCNGRSLNETLAFIQTWLCFGLLQSCLQCSISTDDFVLVNANGRRVWTNRILEQYLQRWKATRLDLDDRTGEMVFETALGIINEASKVSDVLDWYARHRVASGDFQMVELQEQTFLVGQLHDALCSANRKIRRPGVWHGIADRRANKGHMSSWLETQYRLQNWCPFTIRNLKLHYDHGAQAYTFALGTSRTERSHAECTQLRCVANQLKTLDETKHRRENCSCERMEIRISDVVGVLESGQVPAFTIDRTPAGFQLVVKPIEAGSRYVAVSHVWADGLANPLANQLPTCQVEYLRDIVDWLLRYQPRDPQQKNDFEDLDNIPIWFDGLCIPVQPEYQALRDFSITKMRLIYDNATGVIVLDPDIQRLSQTTSTNELLMRLLLSGWSSRLWTFQEGALALDVYLVGNGCVFNLLDIRRENVRLPSGARDKGLSYTLDGVLCSRLYLDLLLTTYQLEHNPARSYQRLLAAVSSRSTSRPDDETVVLASFLDLDTTPIVREPDPTQRMLKFVQMLPFIPPNVLFAWGPRLSMKDSTADWGWVPRTLLAPYGVNDLIVDDQMALDLSHPDNLSSQPKAYIHRGPQHGLAAMFPGILIAPADHDIPEPLIIDTPSGSFSVHDAAYDYTSSANGRLRPWTFRIPGLQSAIILSSSRLSNMRSEAALLVHYTLEDADFLGFSDSGSARTFRAVFIGRMVRITSQSRFHEPFEPSMPVRGTLVDPTWWLINPFPADYEAEKKRWLFRWESPDGKTDVKKWIDSYLA